MINQIKIHLQKSIENNARKSRIDNLVSDLAVTLQMCYAFDDETLSASTDMLFDQVQRIISNYHYMIDNYEPEKKSE